MGEFQRGYSVLIEPLSADNGGRYLATVPDLLGCLSVGETREEAAYNVEDAIWSSIEAVQHLGQVVPQSVFSDDVRGAARPEPQQVAGT